MSRSPGNQDWIPKKFRLRQLGIPCRRRLRLFAIVIGSVGRNCSFLRTQPLSRRERFLHEGILGINSTGFQPCLLLTMFVLLFFVCVCLFVAFDCVCSIFCKCLHVLCLRFQLIFCYALFYHTIVNLCLYYTVCNVVTEANRIVFKFYGRRKYCN